MLSKTTSGPLFHNVTSQWKPGVLNLNYCGMRRCSSTCWENHQLHRRQKTLKTLEIWRFVSWLRGNHDQHQHHIETRHHHHWRCCATAFRGPLFPTPPNLNVQRANAVTWSELSFGLLDPCVGRSDADGADDDGVDRRKHWSQPPNPSGASPAEAAIISARYRSNSSPVMWKRVWSLRVWLLYPHQQPRFKGGGSAVKHSCI